MLYKERLETMVNASEFSKQLLTGMLTKDPEERLSVAEILHFPQMVQVVG